MIYAAPSEVAVIDATLILTKVLFAFKVTEGFYTRGSLTLEWSKFSYSLFLAQEYDSYQKHFAE